MATRRRVKQVTSLDLAKHLSARLSKLVERRDRQVETATSLFRLDMLAAIEDADAETIDLVQRGLKHDGGSAFLQLALQTALDERERAAQTRRSGGARAPAADSDDAPIVISTVEQAVEIYGEGSAAHEWAKANVPPPTPAIMLDTVTGTVHPNPDVVSRGTAVGPDGAEVSIEAGEFRYPEPGEPAVTLPDGTVVAA